MTALFFSQTRLSCLEPYTNSKLLENNIEKEFICGYDISTCKYDYQ